MTSTETKRQALIAHLNAELESALICGDYRRAYNLKTWLNFVSRIADRAQVNGTYSIYVRSVNPAPQTAQLSLF